MGLNFEVVKKTNNSSDANGNDLRLVNLGPIALFSNFELTTSSGKHLEDISHAHIVSLKYKLKTSEKSSDNLFIGTDRGRNRRRDELTNNKKLKIKYNLRIRLKGII